MSLPKHSASSLAVFKECPAQYKAKYIDKLKGIDTTYGVFGTALHHSIEYAYKQDDLPYTAFMQKVDAELSKYKGTPKGYDRRTMLTDGYSILDLFDFEQYKPIAHEVEFFVPFPKINSICVLHGYIDLITDTGTIVDFKSSKTKAKTYKGKDGIRYLDTNTKEYAQLLIYVYAYEQVYGTYPQRAIIHHLRDHTVLDFNFTHYEEELVRLQEIVTALNTFDFSNVQRCNSCSLFCALNPMNKDRQ